MAGDAEALRNFRAFDFDNEPAWADYLTRVEIPSATSDDVMLRLKAKWYTKNVDTSVTLTQLLGGPSGTPPSQPATTTPDSPPPPQSTATRDTAPATGSSGSSSRQPVAAPIAGAARPWLLFILHVAVILLALLSAIPFTTSRLYRALLQLNVAACMLKLHAAHGAPPFRPLASLKAWATRAMPTTDFQYMMLSLVFIGHAQTTLLLVPITIVSLYHAVAFADSQFRGARLWQLYGVKAHRWLAQKQNSALQVNAAAEIMLGFLLLVQLLTPARNFMLIYIYWNMLKLRFWAPDTRQYHQHVWRVIGRKAMPLVAKVRLLHRAVATARSWFHSGVQGGR